ncbi:Solute carrier family 35 member F6 [Fasciolopsis buskii]|uniref:Solute carrier family 35 member F6 n=1 Tax=Fasciolopsis buskii TaxID=27845 RepID=A0A8E0RNT5_9TREM|nr:Solute carrier family 35 member F6 [Fasciolopsis buski]
MDLTLRGTMLILCMLLAGTTNTVTRKMCLDSSAPGLKNNSANGTRTVHLYNKPWFQTFTMFLGEIQCFIVFFILQLLVVCRGSETTHQKICYPNCHCSRGSKLDCVGLLKRTLHWVFLLLSCCDLLATIISGIGLLYIDASIWQMMRGSLIIFSGLISVIFLRRKLQPFHWTGMLVTVFGLVLVGSKSVFGNETNKHNSLQAAIGVTLVLLGALTSAVQMIVEEIYMQQYGYHPLQAVGAEGVYGTLIVGLLGLPIVHWIPGSDINGSYENILDAMAQIGSELSLLINSILYSISMAWFNYCGFEIAKSLSTIHRTLIDALRTAFVWITGLILHYAVGPQFGEPFSPGWGLIELCGFALLLIGTMIYNQMMDLSFIRGCNRTETQTDVAEIKMKSLTEEPAYLTKV